MTTVVTIGGKRFTKADLARRTVRMDHFMSGVFRRTGVDRTTPTADELSDPMQFLVRMHSKLLASGHACAVLSAFLLPEGVELKDWRPETAQEIQDHLESCDTEEDRQLVSQLAFEVMTGFFRRGLLSLMTILGSSPPSEDHLGSKPPLETSESPTKVA